MKPSEAAFDTANSKAIINSLPFARGSLKVYSVAMIIDLADLEKSSPSFDFLIDANEIDLTGENVSLKSPVRVVGRINKGIVQTEVAGDISATLELECTRCLQMIEQTVEIPFSSSFVTAENYTQSKEAEIGKQDLDVSVFEGDKIDLSEIVREQILLNLPEQIFCREDCQGLCEKCGANRNLINCKCIEKEVDPRWQGLRELKIKN